jgi:hypothetical protein
LWRETLKVLKDLKTDQSTPPSTQHDAAAIPGADAAAASETPSKAGPKTQSKQSGRASSASTTLANQASRESKLLEGALVVLKRVLKQEAPEMGKETPKPERTKKASAAADAAPTAPAASSEENATEAKKPEASSPGKEAIAEKPAAKASKSNASSSAAQTSKLTAPLVPKTKKKMGEAFTVESVNATNIAMRPIVKPQPPVPKLAYGLDRVLFNPGVYAIQDPRSRVYNFDPYLARIMPIQDFDFNALKQYITSSKDNTLIQTAAEHKKKYTGSTSSMTSTLSHFHYLLSAWRPIDASMMSREFEPDSNNFTRINRAPAATFLHLKDGTYAIDADKEFDTANVLSMLGKSMEKFLTLPKDEFEKYRKTRSDQLTDEERNGPESYHYTTLGDFMMRSQLDAYDPRLPGTGMFDLKTRAVVSIRMDASDIHKGLGYEIRGRHGQWESFEREYFDMIRSAFLKYSLQVRMGRMDGIFVAFHNTERIFGFQYISVAEMDRSIHGTADMSLGNREFKLSVHLLNKVLDKVTAKYPGRSLRLHFETRTGDAPFMYIFAKPVDADEIEKIQGARRAAVDEFEQRMMGIKHDAQPVLEDEEGGEEIVDEDLEEHLEEAEGEEETSADTWEDVMLKVENELEDEEHGVTFVREAIENALQESGLLRTTAPDETQRTIDSFLEALTSNGASSDTAQNQLARSGESGRLAGSSDGVSESDAATTHAVHGSAEEGQDSVHPPTAGGSHAEEPTLKDMIVKLASRIRVSPGKAEGQAEEGVPAEALKLRKIEKILSELTETRESSDVQEGEGSGVIETGSVSAEQATETVAESATPSGDGTTRVPEPANTGDKKSATQLTEPFDGGEVYGLILTVRNKVNGKYVQRPEKMSRTDRWVVEYAMEEIKEERAQNLYRMVLNRRQKLLDPDRDGDDEDDGGRWHHMFRGKLDKYTDKGRKFRQRENDTYRPLPVHVYGDDKTYTWDSVFEHSKDDGTKPYEEWRPEVKRKLEAKEAPRSRSRPFKGRNVKEGEEQEVEEEEEWRQTEVKRNALDEDADIRAKVEARKMKEEEARKSKEEEARKSKEEEARKSKEEEARKIKEEADRHQAEVERKVLDEDAEIRAQVEARKIKVAEERKVGEEEEQQNKDCEQKDGSDKATEAEGSVIRRVSYGSGPSQQKDNVSASAGSTDKQR